MTLWFFRMVLRILVALLPVGISFNYLYLFCNSDHN